MTDIIFSTLRNNKGGICIESIAGRWVHSSTGRIPPGDNVYVNGTIEDVDYI